VFYTPTSGLFSPLAFAGGSQANFVNGIIATVIGMVVAFIVTWFFGFTKEQLEGKEG
jgi:PTS system beta-glucosides-specific IIC component